MMIVSFRYPADADPTLPLGAALPDFDPHSPPPTSTVTVQQAPGQYTTITVRSWMGVSVPAGQASPAGTPGPAYEYLGTVVSTSSGA